MTPKEPTKLKSVTLIDRHEHGGKPCVAGDKIEVTPRQEQWLIRHKKVAGPAVQEPVVAAAAAKGKE